ncbi:uncharacterized protein IL334_007478 [Kwoniella shivajii]|uniref:FAD dependent oxidoreductase domain-containing protein n=1 Tax=Kwoniella shivajii TaxID=564305 RepID=A0ABZ1D8S2_9TREE|nr:hypothetical protein IL334_007478 [Kwoniella shivajii]
MSTFPQPWISTVSHWQATNRGPTSLYLHNSEADLPTTADVVIIGGGMMGSALSYNLTRPGAYGDGKKIVCVEAKDVASGASGRNGGHVGPSTYYGWNLHQQPYPLGLGCSAEEATRIMQNERDNLDLVESIVKKEDLDVDFWRGELIETHHSAEETEESKRQYEAWLQARKDYGFTSDHDTRFVDERTEATELSRFKGVTSIHIRPAGSVHSHKLATALMQCAIDSTAADFSFYSWTPVSGFPEEVAGGDWLVKTSKGNIQAKKVILCTNAHTPNFFPKDDPLHTHIQPKRSHCALITPPPTYSGAQALKNTYNMSDDHYLVQTPMGGIVIGGGLPGLVRDDKFKAEDSFGQIDDSEAGIDPAYKEHYNNYLKDNFIGWGPEGYGEGLTRIWVGILSTVKDGVPLVGEVPGKKGVLLNAGFAGHGMSRIFTVARAYENILRTGTWDENLLPRSFELTSERLQSVLKAQQAFEAKNGTGKITDSEGVIYETKTTEKAGKCVIQ